MMLEKISSGQLFRQFRGRQEIVFSNLQSRNVTLIHAENGFGKTALLNALLWGILRPRRIDRMILLTRNASFTRA